MPNDLHHAVPDGGWGWVIVAGVCIINMFNQSVLSLFGLLFGEHLHSIAPGTTAAALVSNLNSFAFNFSGLLIGPAIKNFSARKVAFTGSLMVSLGLMSCAIATKLWEVILGYSVAVGLGLGLISASTFLIINSYFKERRGRAVGIALAGTGVGQMIMPYIVRFLLEHYGYKTAVLIVGALCLQGLIGAALFRPVEMYRKQNGHRNIKEVKLLLDLKGDEKKALPDVQIKLAEESEVVKAESKAKSLCKTIFQRVILAMDLELLKDPVFLNIIIGMGLIYTATVNFSMLFPYLLQHSVGLSRMDTAHCMSASAGADIISRLLLPFITDKLKVSYRLTFLFGVIGFFVARTIFAETTNFYTLIAISAFCGAAKAATVVNNNLTISEHCKPEKLPGGVGLNMISKGLVVISVGQLLGWFRDYSDSYPLTIHAQNILVAIVIITWTIEMLYRHVKSQKADCDKITNSIC